MRILRTVPDRLLDFQWPPDEGDIQLQDMSKYPESFFLMRLHYLLPSAGNTNGARRSAPRTSTGSNDSGHFFGGWGVGSGKGAIRGKAGALVSAGRS